MALPLIFPIYLDVANPGNGLLLSDASPAVYAKGMNVTSGDKFKLRAYFLQSLAPSASYYVPNASDIVNFACKVRPSESGFVFLHSNWITGSNYIEANIDFSVSASLWTNVADFSKNLFAEIEIKDSTSDHRVTFPFNVNVRREVYGGGVFSGSYSPYLDVATADANYIKYSATQSLGTGSQNVAQKNIGIKDSSGYFSFQGKTIFKDSNGNVIGYFGGSDGTSNRVDFGTNVFSDNLTTDFIVLNNTGINDSLKSTINENDVSLKHFSLFKTDGVTPVEVFSVSNLGYLNAPVGGTFGAYQNGSSGDIRIDPLTFGVYSAYDYDLFKIHNTENYIFARETFRFNLNDNGDVIDSNPFNGVLFDNNNVKIKAYDTNLANTQTYFNARGEQKNVRINSLTIGNDDGQTINYDFEIQNSTNDGYLLAVDRDAGQTSINSGQINATVGGDVQMQTDVVIDTNANVAIGGHLKLGQDGRVGHIHLRNGQDEPNAIANNTTIYALSGSSGFGFKESANNNVRITINNTAQRTYLLPDVSGTVGVLQSSMTGSGHLLTPSSSGELKLITTDAERQTARRTLDIPKLSQVYIAAGASTAVVTGSVNVNIFQNGGFVSQVLAGTLGIGRTIVPSQDTTPGYFPQSSINTIDWTKSWTLHIRMSNRCATQLGANDSGRFTLIVGNPAISPTASLGHNLDSKGVAIKFLGKNATTGTSDVWITAHNGTSETPSSAYTVTAVSGYITSDWELSYIAGVGLYLYQDGTLRCSLTTGLPTGDSTANHHKMGWLFENTVAGASLASTHYINSINVIRD